MQILYGKILTNGKFISVYLAAVEWQRKAVNERNLNEGQREDRKQWSLGVEQRKKAFWNN